MDLGLTADIPGGETVFFWGGGGGGCSASPSPK